MKPKPRYWVKLNRNLIKALFSVTRHMQQPMRLQSSIMSYTRDRPSGRVTRQLSTHLTVDAPSTIDARVMIEYKQIPATILSITDIFICCLP